MYEYIIGGVIVVALGYAIYRWNKVEADHNTEVNARESVPSVDPVQDAAVKPLYEQPVRSAASAVYEQPAAPVEPVVKKRRSKKAEVVAAPVVEKKTRRRRKDATQ